MLRRFLLALTWLSLSFALPAQAQDPATQAQEPFEVPAYNASNFARANAALHEVCEADNGALWGVSLCRPLLVVHQPSRLVWASEAGAGGLLQPHSDGIWTGTLTNDVPLTEPLFGQTIEWAGVRWSSFDVLYANPNYLRVLMLSGAFRNVQDSLGIPSQRALNPQMDSEQGRYYLRLEMRALTRAMRAEGDERREAALDALHFRAARHARFPEAIATERIADRTDGLAEYTGVRISLGDQAESYAATEIELQNGANGFTYFYAKLTVPAYGLMLDEVRPNWRRELGEHSPADLLARALRHRPITGAALAQRTDRYGGESIGAEERRWAEVEQIATEHTREIFTTWPRVELPLSADAQIEFEGTQVQRIPLLGTIGGVVVRDVWGEARGGAVITEDRRTIILSEPMPGGLSGDSWAITLAPGYRMTEPDTQGVSRAERIR